MSGLLAGLAIQPVNRLLKAAACAAALIVALLIVPVGAGAVDLYAQTGSEGADFAPSNFFADNDQDQTADDFVVPTGQSWLIDQVRVSGEYSVGETPPSIVNVFFYADANGSPGAVVFSQSGITAPGGPDYAIPLSGAPLLLPGTYWVSVQQKAEGGYWAWTTRTVPTGNLAMSRVLLFMGGFTPWEPRRDRWEGTDPDLIFTLGGTSSPYPPPPSNIITLGKPKLNKKKGTAKLPVTVPGPGTLTLTGKGVVKQTKTPTTAATVNLLVKSKGKQKKKLNNAGKVKVKVTVTYTPTGGTANSQGKGLVLKKSLH